ncbi:hypothetical protein ES703_72360 [subsurface metagenome]
MILRNFLSYFHSFKLYPSCRHTHPPIDATLALVLENDLRWQTVERVEVHTYSVAINLCSGGEIKNPYKAKFNIPFAVATALKYKSVGLESFSELRIKERALMELSEKVRLHLDSELDALYPAKWPARVTIYLKGGDRISTTINTPKGDPDNPPSKEELRNKFRDNASVSLSSSTIEALIEKIDCMDKLRNISDLLRDIKMKD